MKTGKIVQLFILALAALMLAAPQALAQGKKAVMIVAKSGLEDTEYSTTRRVLEGAGITCVVASTSTGTAKGKKVKAKVDLALSDVVVADYDAVVFIGGGGSFKLWDNKDAQRIALQAVEQNKILGAICASPGTLAKAGVLKGRKATSHPSIAATVREGGADYQDQEVVVDGNLVTANGPRAAEGYGNTLVDKLR